MKNKVLRLEKKSTIIQAILLRLRLLNKAGMGLYFLNFIFHYLFRLNKSKFILHFTSRIIAPSKVVYNKDIVTLSSFLVSGGCYFQALNGIKLGKNFLFAPGIKLISSNHDSENRNQIVENLPIIIGNDVWIGTNAIILPGVEIGNNCIIGAGAVVTRSFKGDYLIIAGNPAREIGRIKNSIEIL
jgi:acetyltransferase-like isoleucine patch superfamily enzyme